MDLHKTSCWLNDLSNLYPVCSQSSCIIAIWLFSSVAVGVQPSDPYNRTVSTEALKNCILGFLLRLDFLLRLNFYLLFELKGLSTFDQSRSLDIGNRPSAST